MPDNAAVQDSPGVGDLAAQFRGMMRRMAQSVTIITTRDANDVPHGMAASAVISVSLEPPSMCVSINRSASMHPILASSRAFCINILQTDQSELVKLFSTSGQRERRFLSADWERGARQLPYLKSAQAAIFCATDVSVDYATHTLHIGRVIDLVTLDDRLPLLWFDGSCAAVSRPTASEKNA
jgi:flavin reductase (DIM6/NTAB) family NADH-FMN oxidoreductase RutF